MKRTIKIISIMMICMLSVGMYGCGTKSPSDTVKIYFDEVKKGESADFSSILNETLDKEEKHEDSASQNDESSKKIIEAMKDLTYTINSENIDGDSATVNVKVNGPDLATVMGDVIKKVFENAFSQAFSNNKMTDEETNKLYDKILLESLNNVQLTERTGDVSLTKVDGKWKINTDDSLTKLLLNIDSSMFNDPSKK